MMLLFRCIKREMPVAFAAFCLLFAVSDIRGQKANGETTPDVPADIRILAYANPVKATVGDPIRIDLDISMPAGYRAEVSRPRGALADFSLVDFLPGPALPGEQDAQEPALRAKAHHRARIVVTIYKTGKFTFPSIPVKIRTAGGNEIAGASPTVELEIQSVLTGNNPALKDLKKQAGIQEYTQWRLWAMLAVAACLLCVLIWYLLRQRRRRPVPLTPAQMQDQLEMAETDLHNLLAQGFPGKGEEKQFYVRLSDILKRILGAGYGIHTAERTTSEIMEALDRNSIPRPEEKRRIESFLFRCDIVKFAKYMPSFDEHAGIGDDALHILATVKEAVRSRQLALGGGQ